MALLPPIITPPYDIVARRGREARSISTPRAGGGVPSQDSMCRINDAPSPRRPHPAPLLPAIWFVGSRNVPVYRVSTAILTEIMAYLDYLLNHVCPMSHSRLPL